MTTALTTRIAAATASFAIVAAILAGIGALAQPPVTASLLAQAATTTTVR